IAQNSLTWLHLFLDAVGRFCGLHLPFASPAVGISRSKMNMRYDQLSGQRSASDSLARNAQATAIRTMRGIRVGWQDSMANMPDLGPLLECFPGRTWRAGRLAQLVRAPALQAGGRRFESCTAHQSSILYRDTMRQFRKTLAAVLRACPMLLTAARSQTTEKPDLSKQPTLYVVGYAHLDTEWRWEYPQVISEYIRKTMEDNFTLFDKYPHYVFNFSGANRYRFMKEYYPADFARLKKYVDQGRWFPTGSSMEEGDVNAPSAEAIIRQVLYGNDWFRKDLGKASAEYMLPDCFGFPSSLPTILAHSGVKGFSTQKLVWGSSANAGGPESLEQTPEGTPFNVGTWVGPDGKSVLAGFNPGSYS